MAILEYKCPNCGAAIVFDATTQKMTCPHCGSSFDVAQLQNASEPGAEPQTSEAIDWGYKGTDWAAGEQAGMLVYTCSSCGGEVVADQTVGATKCPFCDNPLVVGSQFSGTLRPDVVIPFKYDKDAAVKALANHYKGKRLLPKVFADQNHLDEVKGVYVPFWLFTADAHARVEYEATRVRMWSDSDNNYTETQYFHVVREGQIGFDNIPVDGSSQADDTMMESLEPFRYADAVPFQTAYLSGYLANKYDVDAAASVDRANVRIWNTAAEAFRDTVQGYATVVPVHTDIRPLSRSVQYALLPVWLLNTSWQGKNYQFAMNGQTGKLIGDLPADNKAMALWIVGLFLAVGAVLVVLWLLISTYALGGVG
ncbi:MAG: zinc ribbon domain-containing protein [Propionibacteriaceae bacterium]|jgi:DNA-directed RNA polymerase subunit RPC12/RpoP|nr:zinc ribbon domain-containing protein [Propionibacteriaceae bacterium]